jgi:biopolymer transport protein ExbB
MEFYLEQLGPVGWPLLLCSMVAAALIIERLVCFLRLGRVRPTSVREMLAQVSGSDGEAALCRLAAGQRPLARGVNVLLAHRDYARSDRSEIVSLWLREHQAQVTAHLRGLHLMAVVAPLLGLLGTVLGMIVVFKRISENTGPVNPAMLADGLWAAMITTAVGLCIAIPAMVASQGFRIWGHRHIEGLAITLSHISLALDRPSSQRGDP